jgi:hypothetical protein
MASLIKMITTQEEKMMQLDTNDLNQAFAEAYSVEIVSITDNMALLNIRTTEEYRSRKQTVVMFQGKSIVCSYDIHEEDTYWNCIYALDHETYCMGGSLKNSEYAGAKLALFNKDNLLSHLLIHKGYQTEITRIESYAGNTLSVWGFWYRSEAMGGHDELYPESWDTVCSIKNNILTDRFL